MNARACFANFINERFMPGPLENADDELVNIFTQRFGHEPDVDSCRQGDIHHANAFGTNNQLFHVAVGCVHEPALPSTVAARTAIAFGVPFAQRFVPSRGSTAIWMRGPS